MTSTPLISAVIPAYNAANFLPQVIQSVLNQSYENWELLIIDDGSTDETKAVVDDFCKLDSRIKLISKENGGVSVARNLGAELAKGRLIAFLDSDDLWLENKLTVHAEYMTTHPHVGASFSRVKLIESDGTTTQKTTNNIVDKLQPQDLFYSNPTVTTSNLVIRKSVFQELNGFDESMQYNEDIDLLFRLSFQDTWAIEGIDQVLVQYRLHSSGLSSTLMKMEEGWATLMQKARQKAPELVDKHYSAAKTAQLQYLARQTLRLNLSALLGVTFINRALISDWWSFCKNPKSVLLALLLYFKLATFNLFKFSI